MRGYAELRRRSRSAVDLHQRFGGCERVLEKPWLEPMLFRESKFKRISSFLKERRLRSNDGLEKVLGLSWSSFGSSRGLLGNILVLLGPPDGSLDFQNFFVGLLLAMFLSSGRIFSC